MAVLLSIMCILKIQPMVIITNYSRVNVYKHFSVKELLKYGII